MSNFKGIALAAGLTLGLGAPAWADTASAPPPPVLFTHVNVVPMDRERVMRDQSVLVDGGAIVAIGPKLPTPAGAKVIDGHGTQYLSPGLADMHIHASTRRDMAVFLANGVTTVLNMGGARASFMDQVVPGLNRGDIPGPHFYAGFVVDGTSEYGQFVIATPAEARGMVDIAKTNGYDFIKVYNNIAPDTFQAFIDAGKEKGVPVIGHGVTRVGLERQFAAGQMMVAHTEEYLYTVFFKPGADLVTEPTPTTAQIPAAIAFTKASGAYVTADLNTFATVAAQWGKPGAAEAYLRDPQVRYLDPDDRLRWLVDNYSGRKGSVTRLAEFLKVFTKAMSDAGVPLITGTDTPTIPGLPVGASLHADLAALEGAGLTRYQALSAATRTPGEFMAKVKPSERRFGTVSVGARADLILTAANPLDHLGTLQKPLGVAANGRWYDATALQGLLDGVLAQYRAVAEPPH
jgi:hypothetical protein